MRRSCLRGSAGVFAQTSCENEDGVRWWRQREGDAMRVRIQYFAALKEFTGCAEEWLDIEAPDLDRLLRELRARHGFAWPRDLLRVGRNGRFADWRQPLEDGDRVALMPPFSGL